ncbi:hypothetical protein Hdeb2414_s0028g00697901 [Helianthus debilis subsp. tardiflorus]
MRGCHVKRKTRGDGYHARVGLTLLTQRATVAVGMMTSVPGVNSNVALNDLSHQHVRVQISKFPAIKITSNFRQKLHKPRKLNVAFNNLARLIGQTINPSRPALVAAQLKQQFPHAPHQPGSKEHFPFSYFY